MGCLVALIALISPRLAIFLMWLFTDRLRIAFDSGWVGLLGFLFLPWTTLVYALAYAPFGGVTDLGWVLVGIALFADLASYGSGERSRRRRD
ncbi:hypothetical protein PO878_00680 [Iamia majanohamensis]|uniref:Uncharacterized protein n=1 Tax=Iamia majanohamensis TaxID=467976 RepID=A0AAF0BRT6_9ACTN|nr:hypothetical protein [Iamia majanohamensis]WCO67236.1 hypothetical protein PO878_00680 [Iamia majanohamensis]